MEKLTLKRFIFNEVISVRLIEQTNMQGTVWIVFVNTLNDNQEEDNLVYEAIELSREDAIALFNDKILIMSDLVS